MSKYKNCIKWLNKEWPTFPVDLLTILIMSPFMIAFYFPMLDVPIFRWNLDTPFLTSWNGDVNYR